MEDKTGTKHPRSLSKEGTPSFSSASTPPPASSGSPPPPESPSEVTSCRYYSLVFEQDQPSERITVVDLTSDEEENIIPDTSWDEEFVKRLFGDLNCGRLGPPGDGKVIILSNSNEEEEVREETTINANVASSFPVRSPAPITSATDADGDPKGVQDDNSDGLAP
jgi:hypothetical protein